MDRVRLAKGCPRSGGAASCCRYPLRRASIGFPSTTGPRRTRSGPAPVEIRPAATVMLVRDAPEPAGGTSLEVLMVRRNLRSDFVGGAYVFPGGAVDPLDGGPEAEAICAGRTDAGASAAAGLRVGRPRLLGRRGPRDLRGGGHPPGPARGRPRPPGRDPEEEAALRRRAGRRQPGHAPLPRPLPRRGPAPLGRRHPLLRPLDHPAGRAAPLRHPLLRGGGAARARSPRTTPGRPSPRSGSRRTTRWPGTAPARSRSSSRPSATSRPSAASPRAPRCCAAAEEASSAVPAIEPRVVPDGNGMRIVLPGDPGYERGAVPDPGDGSGAGRLQRGGARGLHAGQRGGPRRRARTPPAGEQPGEP